MRRQRISPQTRRGVHWAKVSTQYTRGTPLSKSFVPNLKAGLPDPRITVQGAQLARSSSKRRLAVESGINPSDHQPENGSGNSDLCAKRTTAPAQIPAVAAALLSDDTPAEPAIASAAPAIASAAPARVLIAPHVRKVAPLEQH